MDHSPTRNTCNKTPTELVMGGMAREMKQPEPSAPKAAPEEYVYIMATPLWQKYYRQVRKTIKFPRYYKKELNW
jgi:hypothetical protein